MVKLTARVRVEVPEPGLPLFAIMGVLEFVTEWVVATEVDMERVGVGETDEHTETEGDTEKLVVTLGVLDTLGLILGDTLCVADRDTEGHLESVGL